MIFSFLNSKLLTKEQANVECILAELLLHSFNLNESPWADNEMNVLRSKCVACEAGRPSQNQRRLALQLQLHLSSLKLPLTTSCSTLSCSFAQHGEQSNTQRNVQGHGSHGGDTVQQVVRLSHGQCEHSVCRHQGEPGRSVSARARISNSGMITFLGLYGAGKSNIGAAAGDNFE